MKKDICAHCGDEIWKARSSEMPTFPPDLEFLLTVSNKLDPQWRHLADGLQRCQVRHTLATPSDETVV